MDLLDQLLKVTKNASMDFDSIVEDFMMEEPVAVKQANQKAQQVQELEDLKDKQEKELEALKDKHERTNGKLELEKEKESEDDAIQTKRDAEKKSNEKQSEGLLNFIDTWRQELDEVSAADRLTARLKKKGLDLDKIAKERAKEHAALVKKYGKKNESFDLDEGKLVASVREVLKVITKKIELQLDQEYAKNPEKALGMINTLGAMVGHKVTDQKQDKNKLFLTFGETFEFDEITSNYFREESLDEARAKQAVSQGKVQKLVTAHGLLFKGKKYDEIDMELKGIDNNTKEVTFNIIHPKEIFGNEVKLAFKVLSRGPFMATDTSKINSEEEVEESRYTDEKDKRQKATLKKHDKRMIKISRDSIKKYEKDRKEETEVEEDRDYKRERENYGGRPEQMERNAARKRARRQMEKEGKAKAGDGKDVHHKDNNPLNNDKNNLSLVTQNYNRREPRLRMKKLKEKGVLPNVRK